MNLFKQIILYLRFVVRRLVDDRCLTVAGSLTYTILLALVPNIYSGAYTYFGRAGYPAVYCTA